MSPARRRIIYAAIVATLAFAAPLLLWWLRPWGPASMWLGPWGVAPVVGAMVFQLLSRPRPEWWHGLTFAVIPALVFGIWAGIDPPSESSSQAVGAGQAAVYGACFFGIAWFAGMVGASVASFFARMFDRKPPDHSPRRFQPWHLGAALALVDIVAVVAVAVILA